MAQCHPEGQSQDSIHPGLPALRPGASSWAWLPLRTPPPPGYPRILKHRSVVRRLRVQVGASLSCWSLIERAPSLCISTPASEGHREKFLPNSDSLGSPHTHTHTQTDTHIHVQTHTGTYTHAHPFTYTHTDTHTYTHAHRYTHIHIDTHTHCDPDMLRKRNP